MQKIKTPAHGIMLLLLIGCSLTGPACAPKTSQEKVAVKINGHVITVREFNELYEATGPEKTDTAARERFLDNLITRKLLILEAKKAGLDQQEDFLKSIKNFWEQTLLKSLIDKRVTDSAADVQVSDEEIEKAYQKWLLENPGSLKDAGEVRSMIRWQIVQEKQAKALLTWTDELRSHADIQVDRKAVGLE